MSKTPQKRSKNGILSRFEGERGKELILSSLRDQAIILGNHEAANEILARGQLTHFDKGDLLIAEGDWSNEIIFILAGRVETSIFGFKIAERVERQHVGEMALIDPSKSRSATIRAIEPTVGLTVSEENFAAVASHHPDMWRQIAKEISERLRQRKKFIRPSNPTPLLFIACATESLEVAEAIKEQIAENEVVVELWTDGVFQPSKGTMESLEGKIDLADFAVAVFSGDDQVKSRGEDYLAPRDNTVFELGLFAGAIGRERSFFVVQRDVDVKIPSDLAGITSLGFTLTKDCSAEPDIKDACKIICDRISALGPR